MHGQSSRGLQDASAPTAITGLRGRVWVGGRLWQSKRVNLDMILVFFRSMKKRSSQHFAKTTLEGGS